MCKEIKNCRLYLDGGCDLDKPCNAELKSNYEQHIANQDELESKWVNSCEDYGYPVVEPDWDAMKEDLVADDDSDAGYNKDYITFELNAPEDCPF